MAEAVDSWGRRTVKNAKDPGPSCYQLGFDAEAENNGEISENCLTVDIYVPRGTVDSENLHDLGIIVWIHGGGYQTGDAKYYSGIEQAVNYGNIVVLVQYRLGIFGFFNYKDSASGMTVGGNYALGDMALAVKFISENAQNLGNFIRYLITTDFMGLRREPFEDHFEWTISRIGSCYGIASS